MTLYINGQQTAPALGSVTLEKSQHEAAACLTAVLYIAPADTYVLKPSVALGNVVRLLDDDGSERFLGTVHELERDADSVTLTAYDAGIYLTRNELFGIFWGSGTNIIRTVAAQLDLTAGLIEAAPEFHRIVTYTGRSAFSILRQAAGNGREIQLADNTLSVTQQLANRYDVTADQILQISSRASIRQMVNRSLVTDHKGNVIGKAECTSDLQTYGQFQTILFKDGSDPSAQAAEALKGRLLSADVKLLGNLGYRCRDAVVFDRSEWGLYGAYRITAVSHNWDAGLFTTELTLEGLDI